MEANMVGGSAGIPAKTLRNFEKLFLQEFNGEELAAEFLKEQKRVIASKEQERSLSLIGIAAWLQQVEELESLLRDRVALKRTVDALIQTIESKVPARDKLDAEYTGTQLIFALGLASDCAKGGDLHDTPLGTMPSGQCPVCQLSKALFRGTQGSKDQETNDGHGKTSTNAEISASSRRRPQK